MGSMSISTINQIAINGSEEDFINLLKTAGGYVITNGDDVKDSGLKVDDRALDYIYYAAAKDSYTARKARKISLAAAYDAHGKEAFKTETETGKRPELKVLRKLAFKSASEKVVELLKAQANDAEAVRAIIDGAQHDHKRFLRRETTEDKNRRSDKKDIIAEFYAKSGRFTPAETDTPDALAAQARITELENRVAEMETAAAKQQPARPMPLRLQQP